MGTLFGSSTYEAGCARRIRTLAVQWALLASGVFWAQAAQASQHLVDLVWGADQRFARTATVAPGKFVEVCGPLRAGEAVSWTYTASAPLDFNIHYHVGKAVEYPAKLAHATQGEGTLKVPLEPDYCWMWTNKTASPAQVSVTFQGKREGPR